MLGTIPVPAHTCTTGAAMILPHRDGEHGTSGHTAPALPSPELELHPASRFQPLLIPVRLSLFFSPFLGLLFHHIHGFLLPRIGCESVVICI